MTSPSKPPAFRLETSVGDRERSAEVNKGEHEPPPMESPFQPEDRNFPRRIRVNIEDYCQQIPNPFDRDRLFSIVSRGAPEELDGLREYLHRTSKFLTDSTHTEGSTGKTCLMKAVLNLKDGVNACILPLLQIDRESGNPHPLVNAQCTDEFYRGHTALHIAIEKRSLKCVQLLVENGADVHIRACGRFFQKHQGTCFYFGELPLSLAACTNQWDVVTYLLKNPQQPARLDATDSLGNTVLHALIMIADNSRDNTALVINMYDRLLQVGADLCPTVQLEEICNHQGLTPLKLAAKEGKIDIFRHILQREFPEPHQLLSRKFTEWCYGPVRVSLYDLSSVDSWEKNSVLEIIAFRCKSLNRHHMVVLEPLNKLLQEKWDRLIPRFLFNFACYLVYMIIFTVVAYHQPPLDEPDIPSWKGTFKASMLLLGHILILLGGIYLLLSELWYFFHHRLFIWMSFMDSYFEILFLIQALLTVLSQVLRFIDTEWYLPLLVIALVLGWLDLLYYTRGFQHTGIYSVMIQKVILRDLLRFLLVYLVFLFGFAVALVSLSQVGSHKAPEDNNGTVTGKPMLGQEEDTGPYEGVLHASLELFKFTIGMGELAFQEKLRFRGVVLLLLLAYILLTYILLLNMLIALMSKTVEKTDDDSWNIWKLQKAIFVLELENGYWWCRRKRHRAGKLLKIGTRRDGFPDERWFFRVEEVNWSAWEKTLPTLSEEPSGAGVTGYKKDPTSKPGKSPASKEDHLSLQALQSH